MTCEQCNGKYDFICANVSCQRFYNTMTLEHRRNWKCPSCRCQTPKSGNSNQPVKQNKNNSQEISYITTRKKTSFAANVSTSSNDQSILGDTIQEDDNPHNDEKVISISYPKDDALTLKNINKLLESHLQRNKESIISEIKIIIKCEIEESILEYEKKLKQTTEKIQSKQQELTETLHAINQKIKILSDENQKLKQEINKPTIEIKKNIGFDTENEDQKSFVLYGLMENYSEPEAITYDRVINAIYDILNIDITGYVEDVSRIGKKGY